MSETNNSEEKSASASGRKPLTLKRKVDAGTVRQNFSHGRSKTVVVEKKRRKTITPKDAANAKAADADAKKTEKPVSKAPEEVKPETAVETESAERSGIVLRTLTEEEKAARTRALEEAKVADAETRKRMEEEANRRARQDTELLNRREQVEREFEDDIRRAEEAEHRRVAEAEAEKALEAERLAAAGDASPREKAKEKADDGGRRQRKTEAEKPISGRKGERKRREGKLTIANALHEDEDRVRSLASVRRARERERRAAQARVGAQSKIFREVVIPEIITIEELANRMAERVPTVIRKLIDSGQMPEEGDDLDADTAQLVAEEFGHVVKRVAAADVEAGLKGDVDPAESLAPRAPVVTVMGHVDHGKTSLLDALRATDVVAGEAGGITQHIGAYQVTIPSGKKITFIDTPGHSAFTAMRARGAKVTDIVVLVVAADDGVMPQTIEAINHAKAAEVPLIVAVNKIDKADADPDRVRQELLQHEIVTEKLGGEVLEIDVSATEKTNLDKLEEAILLQAELLELKANPDRLADGIVIESRLDKGRGPLATTLVRRGTLKVGDIIVAGEQWGRIRALINDKGENVKEAGPTIPVEVLGLGGTPEPGDDFVVVETEGRAREVTEYRHHDAKNRRADGAGRTSLEQMMSKLKEADINEFPIVLKSDVQGSAEAITGALNKLGNEEVAAGIVHSAVGGITESDIVLAAASKAVVIGFNVRANKQAREQATRDGVEIRYYSIIYDVIDDIKAAMEGMLAPGQREHFLGNAEILETFNISKIGRIAGCRVTDGKVRRGAKVRLLRDDVVIHEGALSTLKRFKDEVKEVDSGQECGMAFENYQDLQAGDTIECFEVEEVIRTL